MDKSSLAVSFQRQGTLVIKFYFILLSGTLQEYLISEEIARSGLQQYYISPPEAHYLVAMSSVTYIFQAHGKRHLDCFPCRDRLHTYCVTIGPLHIEHADHKHDHLLLHLIGALCQRHPLGPNEPLSIELLLPFFDMLHRDPQSFVYLCFGPLQLVRSFLDRHPDVINGEGNLLQYAIATHRLDVVQELLKRGQDPTWPALEIDEDKTPRSEALAFMLSVPRYTLEDYTLVCSYLKTVSPDILLHLRAPHQWCPSFIRFLLERGANAGHIDNDGFTALHHCLATINDVSICLEVTQLLVDSGCPICTPARHSPLDFAVFQGFTPVVRFLLDRGCQMPENILHISNGFTCFCLLLQRGANPGSIRHGDTALHALFRRNWPGPTEGLEIVKFLVERGCHIDSTNTLVVDAVLCDITAAQYILDSGAILTGDILLLMLGCIFFSRIPTLAQKILNSGHPCLEMDKFSSALSLCTGLSELVLGRPPLTPNSPSYFEMITFFTRKNAHRLPPGIYKCNDNGATPLHELLDLAESFSAQELLELVRSFVDTGCDILSPDAAGKTPLHFALMLQHGDLVDYLVSKGARFSNVKDLGCIPLKWAIHLPWYQTATAAVGCNENSNSIENAASEGDSRETYQFNRTRT